MQTFEAGPPLHHDHGASLDAASHGLYQTTVEEQQPHSLVDALSRQHSGNSNSKMTSNLAELKTRLCLREGYGVVIFPYCVLLILSSVTAASA